MNTIDYQTLLGYSKTLCRLRGVEDDLVTDIAHDAWIECQRRLWNYDGSSAAYVRRTAYTAILDAIRCHRRWSAADPQHFTESDDGDAAFRAYAAADDWQDPFWLRLFRLVRKEIERDVQRKEIPRNVPMAVNALLKDSRLPIARQKLKVSRPTFGTILKKLKSRFALCYQALNAWRQFR